MVFAFYVAYAVGLLVMSRVVDGFGSTAGAIVALFAAKLLAISCHSPAAMCWCF
jgi:fucose permease